MTSYVLCLNIHLDFFRSNRVITGATAGSRVANKRGLIGIPNLLWIYERCSPVSVRRSLGQAIYRGIQAGGALLSIIGLYSIWYGITSGAFDAPILFFLGSIAILLGIIIVRDPMYVFD